MANATVLTNVGLEITSGLLVAAGSGPGSAVPKYMAIGSGTTEASITDTTLTTEYITGTWSGYARVTGTATQQTTTETDDTAQWVGSWTAPASETVAEAGNFDASTTGHIFVHGNFTGVALSDGDSLQVTITCQYTN